MIKGIVHGMGVLLLVFLCGCAASKPNDQPDVEITFPPYCEEVQEVAGQQLEIVIDHLGLQPEDFYYNGQTYQFNKSISYLGQSFQMHLCPYRKEENGYIQGVEYTMELDENEGTIDAILNLRKEIETAYGPADEAGGNREIEESHLSEAFEAEELWDTKMIWILTRDIPEEIRTKFASTCWAMHFRVLMPNEEGDPTTQGKVYVQLTYKLTQEPRNVIES